MLVLAKPSIHTAPLRNARKKSANTRLGSHRSPRFDSIPYSFRTDAERKAEPTQSDTVPYTHGVAISNMSRAPLAPGNCDPGVRYQRAGGHRNQGQQPSTDVSASRACRAAA